MAILGPALSATLKWEGGYANVRGDSGGETICGISRNNWPRWPGWALVDGTADKNSLLSMPSFMDMVGEFYRTYFWSMFLEELNDQGVANKVFDLRVNTGLQTGVELLQKAIVTVGLVIAVDGQLGPKTIDAANAIHPDELLEQLRREAAYYYNNLVRLKPALKKFLSGWLTRAAS